MPWILRGLRNGVVTSDYPASPDGYADSLRSTAEPRTRGERDGSEVGDLTGLCPTGAISLGADSQPRVDAGACIGCGRCIEARWDLFTWRHGPATAALTRQALVVPRRGVETEDELTAIRLDLADRVRALGRSVHLRHVDAGSDGSEEWEILALLNPVYDVHRLGIFFTASPRHADILLVTGVGTAGMAPPLARTYEAMPHPKVVIAAGTDACSGGLAHPTYVSSPGVGGLLPVDVWVPGSPPSPFSLLHAILLALGRVTAGAVTR